MCWFLSREAYDMLMIKLDEIQWNPGRSNVLVSKNKPFSPRPRTRHICLLDFATSLIFSRLWLGNKSNKTPSHGLGKNHVFVDLLYTLHKSCKGVVLTFKWLMSNLFHFHPLHISEHWWISTNRFKQAFQHHVLRIQVVVLMEEMLQKTDVTTL